MIWFESDIWLVSSTSATPNTEASAEGILFWHLFDLTCTVYYRLSDLDVNGKDTCLQSDKELEDGSWGLPVAYRNSPEQVLAYSTSSLQDLIVQIKKCLLMNEQSGDGVDI